MSFAGSIDSEVSLVKPRVSSKQDDGTGSESAEDDDDITPYSDFIDSFLLEDDDDDAPPPKISSKLPTIPESNLEYEDSETKPDDRASSIRASKDDSLLEKKDKDTVSEESITTISSEESREKIETIPAVEEEPITDETIIEIKPKSVESQVHKEVEEKPKPKPEEEDVGFVFMNDAEEIVFTILLNIIRNITKKAGGEEVAEEEVVVKRRKGPPRKVDEIKMSIDDLSDTYSVHGTEFRRPISYLWKTGMVKDFLIKEEKYLKNLPVHGENVVSLNPYILTRSYGYSPWIPIINLSKKNKVKVAFVVGNAIVIYNYKKNKIQYLQGHRNLIQSMNCDLHTRWIVSADGGYDNTVTVWDIKKRIPLKTYFTPHAKGTRIAAFDLSSRYIITVSFGQQVVDIWSWTQYSDEPVVSVRLNRDTPAVRKICFCYDNLQYFLLTTDTSIICGRFTEEPKLLSLFEGKLLTEVGLLRDSAYVTYTHFVYSVTDKGHAVMWSDKVFQKSFVYNEPRYKKVQIKTMKLLKVGINTIQVIETSKMLVVIGDDKGCVRFYDILFRILYWCEHICPGSVVSTEFSYRLRREQVWKYVVLRGRTTAPDFQNNETFEKISLRNNKNKEEAYKSQLNWRHLKEIPQDVTLQKQTFLSVNFFVSSTNGNIYYVYYAKDKSVVVVQGHTCPLTCVMTHPSSSLVYYGNSEGKLSVYDFYDESMMVEKDLRAEDVVDIKDPNQISYCVTSIGISPVGLEMAVGLENGTLFFLDSNLLEIQAKFQKSTEAIRKIVFDKNVNYMAHTDDGMCVTLYGLGFPRNYMGKFRSHYAPITDIIFTFKSSSLLSIGQDRQIVLYSIPKNFDGLLNITQRKPIEQFAMPLTLIPYNPKDVEAGKVKYHGNVHEISDDDDEDDSEEEDDHDEELILVANDEFKYRLITCSTLKVIKTIQAPSLPSPIKFLSYLPNTRSDKSGVADNKSDDSKDSRDKTDRTTFMLFGTNNEIGIQLLPLSGNPFKSLATVATATNLMGMAVSCDGEYLFTIAENDRSLLMWKINERSVRMSAYYGGTGLDPYYGMLAGGYTGQLLKEMKEYFYYSQIVHEGEYITGARHITDKIHLCDVINYFNAIGFFPSLLEAQTIIEEVKLSKNQRDATQDIEIQFDELVKLYINHRPTKGVKDEDLRKAFRTIARAYGENPEFITRNDFLRVLQQHGEMLSQNEIVNTMNILVNRNPVSDGLGNKLADVNSLLPLIITYKFFVEEILGCDSEKFNFDSLPFSSQDFPTFFSLSGSLLSDVSTTEFPTVV